MHLSGNLRLQHSPDPRSVDNFNKVYRETKQRMDLLSKAKRLKESSSYPLLEENQKAYEVLDLLRCQAAARGEKKCRKLRMG
jgi:hypothetical protein